MEEPHQRKATEQLNPVTEQEKQGDNASNGPSYSELNSMVKKIIEESTWWEKYGIDIAIMLVSIALFPVGLILLGSKTTLGFLAGFFLIGHIHCTLTLKVGHNAIHDSLIGSSKFWNRVFSVLFVECWGGFTDVGARETHIQMHHPYTNIIGMGDSSVWKVPSLGRFAYLFIAPIFLPFVYTLVAANLLGNRWLEIVRLFLVAGLGYLIQLWLYMTVSGLSFKAAFLCVFFIRSMFVLPYIHVNIFQHIGMPMYDPQQKPKSRLYQMSSAVLNLPHNPLLDYSFGHGLIHCHTEHHLFPRLSDNMCLKVKPVVSKYLKSHGFPYNEGTYIGRLKEFYVRYEELMVHAPPITELIGIQ